MTNAYSVFVVEVKDGLLSSAPAALQRISLSINTDTFYTKNVQVGDQKTKRCGKNDKV